MKSHLKSTLLKWSVTENVFLWAHAQPTQHAEMSLMMSEMQTVPRHWQLCMKGFSLLVLKHVTECTWRCW